MLAFDIISGQPWYNLTQLPFTFQAYECTLAGDYISNRKMVNTTIHM
jgi:hypothetical protein